MRRVIYVITVLGVLSIGSSQVDGWPDFRGPTQDGHADQAGVPLRWSEKENVRWKVPIAGVGWSSPVVLGDQVWMTTATAKGHEMSLVSVSLVDGDKIHQRVVIRNADPAPKHDLNSYASPSPVIEAGRVYAHFGSYGTMCLSTETGEALWDRRDIRCDHVTGPGSSPFLYGDLLLLHMDGADVQFVIALDKKTGETRWKTPRSVDLK
ncbi:MAG: PQQ-binding-like beta-propeller repeat protein, partial [Planctomycetota bacterium]|nr:PQQ-binding-like beta-propeller repeat protein [Planctomycetota bacterium]